MCVVRVTRGIRFQKTAASFFQQDSTQMIVAERHTGFERQYVEYAGYAYKP
jgi:hypothetical protein